MVSVSFFMNACVRIARAGLLVAICASAACGRSQSDLLRESFIQQLGANRFVKDLEPNGSELRFTAPGPDGEPSVGWRVMIDSVSVEENPDPAHPYKGVVKSSWFADDRPVVPRGTDSNLPLELMSNGLAQECWALWDPTARRWSWE